jgi:nicotinamide riboside kinase
VTVRIVVTGAESTGKTTLALALGRVLGAPVLEEQARVYAEQRAAEHEQRATSNGTAAAELTADDVEPIARRTIAAEDSLLVARCSLLVSDTDLLSTIVYSRFYYGACPSWIETEARQRLGDRYLVCDIDLPWEADGIRDMPERREELAAAFDAVLAEFGAPVRRIRGVGEARLAAAREAIADLVPGSAS